MTTKTTTPKLYMTRSEILARGILGPEEVNDLEPDATRGGIGLYRLGNVRQLEASIASYTAALPLEPADNDADEEAWGPFYAARTKADNAFMADDSEVVQAIGACVAEMTPDERHALAHDLGKWSVRKRGYLTLDALNEKAAA
jgi:hypothetical protein